MVFEEPVGIQKLKECDMIVMTQEVSCCSHFYSVDSNEGMLFRSKGSHNYKLYDGGNQLITSLSYKSWTGKALLKVQTLNYPLLKIYLKDGHRTTLEVLDEHDQVKLLVTRPPVLHGYFTVSSPEGTEIGRLSKQELREWEMSFPRDLEVYLKASLIATCIYCDMLFAARLNN